MTFREYADQVASILKAQGHTHWHSQAVRDAVNDGGLDPSGRHFVPSAECAKLAVPRGEAV